MKNKIHLAERRAVPGLIGIAGPSGSGKTFSALLLASGLCPEGKRVGLLDTEKGRGEHYADNPIIKAHYPNGYDALQLDEPYSPDRYFEALDGFAQKGNYGVVIIDSASHEWEGFGGCQDIAENNKLGGLPNWQLAKKEHKRFMRKALTLPFHVIFCLRAQEKTAINESYQNGKKKMVFQDLGWQPVQEKNFKYEMLIACMLDSVSQFPIVDSDFHKVPDDLKVLFQGGRHITKQDGLNLKGWIEGGKKVDTELRTLEADFKSASNDGMAGLKSFWDGLNNTQKKKLEPIKDECKKIAAEADRQASESGNDEYSHEPRSVAKPEVKPNEVKNEEVSKPKKTRQEKKIIKEDPEPPKTEVLASDTPTPEASKPVEKKAEPKPDPIPEPVPEPVVEEDDVPPMEDEGTQNAMEIAQALQAEQEEDEIPPQEVEPENPAPAVEEEDDDELDLL